MYERDDEVAEKYLWEFKYDDMGFHTFDGDYKWDYRRATGSDMVATVDYHSNGRV